MTGNTVLVTGGGTGIGRGLAESLHRLGNQVVIAGRRREPLQAVAAANPGIRLLSLDQGDSADIRRFATELTDRFPDLNVLVNNAGIQRVEDLTASGPGAAEQTVAINLLGPIRLTAALLPSLLKKPSAAIVNVTSGLAFMPSALTPTYCATKAALHSYTQSLRFQLRETSVQVIEVIPPQVQTALQGRARIRPERDAAGCVHHRDDDLIGDAAAGRRDPRGACQAVPVRRTGRRFRRDLPRLQRGDHHGPRPGTQKLIRRRESTDASVHGSVENHRKVVESRLVTKSSPRHGTTFNACMPGFPRAGLSGRSCDTIDGVRDFSLLDVPRSVPVDDPEAYLAAAIAWHFGEDTGSRVLAADCPDAGLQPVDRCQELRGSALVPQPRQRIAQCAGGGSRFRAATDRPRRCPRYSNPAVPPALRNGLCRCRIG